jgi:hypothetical protein
MRKYVVAGTFASLLLLAACNAFEDPQIKELKEQVATAQSTAEEAQSKAEELEEKVDQLDSKIDDLESEIRNR